MARYCRSCKYGPVGPYVDNCPICAEPLRGGRREFGSGGGGGGGGTPGWVRWLLGSLLVSALSVAGFCGLGAWQMGNAMRDTQQQGLQAQAQFEAERQARTVLVSAADLLRDFQGDAAAAERKYRGKYLQVSGTVERSDLVRGEQFVILHAGDEAVPVKVECFFYDLHTGRLPEKGQTITVRGEYEGRISHVQLRQCVLVRRGPGRSGTGPAAGTGRRPGYDQSSTVARGT